MSTQAAPPVLPADWTQVLARIEASLADALAQATAREAALGSAAAPPEPSGMAAVLPRLEERMAAIEQCVAQAEDTVAEADAALAEAASGLDQWRTQAGQVGQALVEWTTRAVS
jgi:uncharacterized coiled-coil protein SlyX